jgi:hypothetical protein
MVVSGVTTCSHLVKNSPLLSRSFALRSSSHVPSCDIGRSEDQRQRNPGPQEAGKHLHTSIYQERHHEEVERDHDAYEHESSLQWRRVVELLDP